MVTISCKNFRCRGQCHRGFWMAVPAAQPLQGVLLIMAAARLMLVVCGPVSESRWGIL
jgi:hypothetical protein